MKKNETCIPREYLVKSEFSLLFYISFAEDILRSLTLTATASFMQSLKLLNRVLDSSVSPTKAKTIIRE